MAIAKSKEDFSLSPQITITITVAIFGIALIIWGAIQKRSPEPLCTKPIKKK